MCVQPMYNVCAGSVHSIDVILYVHDCVVIQQPTYMHFPPTRAPMHTYTHAHATQYTPQARAGDYMHAGNDDDDDDDDFDVQLDDQAQRGRPTQQAQRQVAMANAAVGAGVAAAAALTTPSAPGIPVWWEYWWGYWFGCCWGWYWGVKTCALLLSCTVFICVACTFTCTHTNLVQSHPPHTPLSTPHTRGWLPIHRPLPHPHPWVPCRAPLHAQGPPPLSQALLGMVRHPGPPLVLHGPAPNM